MNVSTLLSQGHKISNLAALSDEQIRENIEQLQFASSRDVIILNYINELTYAMLNFDEQAFEKVFSIAVARLGIYESMLHVFYPFLQNTGIMWRVNKALPIEEHFAVCIIRRKLIAITDKLPAAEAGSKKFMLFLPAGEWHEIGLLFANYILRAKGLFTIYLGQNMPCDDIERACIATHPDCLITFYITPKPKEEIDEEIAFISKAIGDATLLVSGNRELLTGVKFTTRKIVFLKDVGQLSQYF
jgi:methanogenic corrinoid protein MtbC1